MTHITYSLVDDWPSRLLTEDLTKIFQACDVLLDEIIHEISAFTDMYDPYKIPDELLDIYILSKGFRLSNDFSNIVVTNAIKRKIAKLVIMIYSQKGTKSGIINVVRLLLGLEIDIKQPNINRWRLGLPNFSELGQTTFISYFPINNNRETYSFSILYQGSLTQDQKDQITSIVNYMKPKHTHLKNILEILPTDHWLLNRSKLGIETTVHSGD